jgi:hypothetical protein
MPPISPIDDGIIRQGATPPNGDKPLVANPRQYHSSVSSPHLIMAYSDLFFYKHQIVSLSLLLFTELPKSCNGVLSILKLLIHANVLADKIPRQAAHTSISYV